MPFIPLLIGGAALFGAGGTTGYLLGVKTEKILIGGGLMAAAYLVYKKAK
jgi:hypothetical protein